VSRAWMIAAVALLSVGCELVNATSDHTARYGVDGGAADATSSPPVVRVVHLARDTSAVNVYLDGAPLRSALSFTDVSETTTLSTGGSVTVRVTRAGTTDMLVEQTFPTLAGHGYTLCFYGDEVAPPFDPPRTLSLLLLDDVLAELDPDRQQLLLEGVGTGHQCLVSATHLGAFSAGWHQCSQVVTVEAGNLRIGQ